MKLKPSILNIYAIIFLVGCIAFTIYNYDQLSEGEGWGLVGMVGLFGLGAILFVADIVIRNIFKNKTVANIIGFVVVVIASLLLFFFQVKCQAVMVTLCSSWLFVSFVIPFSLKLKGITKNTKNHKEHNVYYTANKFLNYREEWRWTARRFEKFNNS